MFWCGAKKKESKVDSGHVKMKLLNTELKRLISRDVQTSSMFWSSQHGNKTSALNFSISPSKIHLAEVQGRSALSKRYAKVLFTNLLLNKINSNNDNHHTTY
jgi:hypothetical protein